MNKSEALRVLHEILDVLRESVTISSVSLDSQSAQVVSDGKGCQIRMKCELDSFSRDCLKPILEKHKLGLKDADGYVTVYQL